jgi:hypothetical protein
LAAINLLMPKATGLAFDFVNLWLDAIELLAESDAKLDDTGVDTTVEAALPEYYSASS